MTESILNAAREFVDNLRAAFDAEASVAFDALLQVGWPSTRIAQTIESVPSEFGNGLRCTLTLTRGIELTADLPVFVVELRFAKDGVTVGGAWLVDPFPMPHASTIASANPRPNPTWCSGCEREISNEVCHCGEYFEDHGRSDLPHAPVPMGCVCHLRGTP